MPGLFLCAGRLPLRGLNLVYSRALVERVRCRLYGRRGVVEKNMFGGVGFLLHGNLLVGVWQASLIVRLGIEPATAALRRAHVREFDVTGRPMTGWIMVEPEGLDDEDELAAWIDAAWAFVECLPRK